jgi:hypothetical protein
MAAVLSLGQIPDNINGRIRDYPRIFHNLDICKDAKEATPSVELTSTTNGTTLFETAMRTLGFTNCGGYSDKLHKLEEGIQRDINSKASVVQKQINRLKAPTLELIRDNGLPLSIKKAIRDSGANYDTYSNTVTALEVASDFSDPATRAPLKGKPHRFPLTNVALSIDPMLLRLMVGNDTIRRFDARINEDNTCDIRFTISFTYKGTQNTIDYGTKILANYTTKQPIPGLKDASDFFNGNPTKNAFFNTNRSAWIIGKNLQEQAYMIGDAIGYLICKEFFGDVLIGLIARLYKVTGSVNGPAAVFTSDNALKALCSILEVDYVAKNWGKNATEESVACLFSSDPTVEIREGKIKILQDIIALNENIRSTLEAYIAQGNIIKGLGAITDTQVTLFHKYIIPYIASINQYLKSIDLPQDTRTLIAFREHYVRYQVKHIVKETAQIRGEIQIGFFRGIYDPFKIVPSPPEGPALRPDGFPDINTEFVVFVQRYRNMPPEPGPKGPVALGKRRAGRGGRRMKGGGATLNATKLRDDLEIAIEEKPSETLFQLINAVLSNYELIDVYGLIDARDVYNYLYGIYDLQCKVCFNMEIIQKLTLVFLEGTTGNLDFVHLRDGYNTLLKEENDAGEQAYKAMVQAAEDAEGAERTRYEVTESNIMQDEWDSFNNSQAGTNIGEKTPVARNRVQSTPVVGSFFKQPRKKREEGKKLEIGTGKYNINAVSARAKHSVNIRTKKREKAMQQKRNGIYYPIVASQAPGSFLPQYSPVVFGQHPVRVSSGGRTHRKRPIKKSKRRTHKK